VPSVREDPPGRVPLLPVLHGTLSGAAAADPGRERKVVSVLFCDLVGSTAAAERSDPEEVQARMAVYFARTRERIEAFGGVVEKFIGDAVMAVFGAHVAHEDDAERAVRAGLSVVEAIEELNALDVLLDLSVRIGVNTGEAVVSLAERPDLGEGLVTGDVVNTGARIQAQAPPGGVVVGAGTFQASERVFVFEPLKPVAAKGKSEPVRVWRAIAPRARFGSDVMRSMTTPLVGRALDLALLTRTFDKTAQDRTVQLVTVVGEPGVGKSRLVAELGSYLDALPDLITWRQGRCLPYGDGIAFWALGEIVKAHAGIYESDAPEVATAKLDAVLTERDDRPWLRARLLPLLGIDAGEVAAREELFTAWRRFLESMAERNPLVLVVEDVQWADEAMLAFLEYLADWAQGVPLLIVATARPELYEQRPAWAVGLANQTAIRLSPLSDEDTARLVAALLEQAVLPAETQQLLLERAGGNPLYAEEFVRMLRDRDLLDESGRLRAELDMPVPESIQALIAARLDTLSRDRKQLLQDAAVMGKVFWTGSTVAMGKRDAREVELALHELARMELVRPARQSSIEGEAEFGFWHLLVRDVAYGQIARPERAAKHLRAASWLEHKAADRPEDMADVLAYHTGEALLLAEATRDDALRAEVAPVAARYALLAGERALGLDTDKALSLIQRARTLTPEDDPAFPVVLLRWAEAAGNAGRQGDAREALERAAANSKASGDLLRAGEALTILSHILLRTGGADALVAGEEAVDLLRSSPGAELLAALAALAHFHWVTGAAERAIDCAEQAFVLAKELGVPPPDKALAFRGLARCDLGDLGGLGDAERALELMIREGKGRDAAGLQHNLGVLRWFLEGPAAALAQFDQATTFATARGLAENAIYTAVATAELLVEAGKLEQAIAHVDGLLPLVRAGGNTRGESEALTARAFALLQRGGDAAEAVDVALRLARRGDDPLILIPAVRTAAAVLQAAGDHDGSRTLLEEIALAPVHRSGEYAMMLPTLVRTASALGDGELGGRLAAGVPETLPSQQHALITVRAILAEQAQEFASAAELYADAAVRWEAFTYVLEQAHALLAQGRCLVALADPAATTPLSEARLLFGEMGAHARTSECAMLIVAAGKLSA
jgi:class 3 adenylate cyclase/tetratricopeptide (TPR) repeat protein